MDITAALVRNLTFPLWTIRDGNGELLRYRGYYDFLDRLTPEQIEQRQFQALREMLVHAAEQTPFYRELFQRYGLDPRRVQEPADIRRLPLLDKKAIRTGGDALRARNVPDSELVPASTGGSTGRPLHFYRDRGAIRRRKAQEWYFDRWMGHRLGEKTALFVAASHFDGAAHRLKARVRNATCERMLRFDPHHITDEYMEQFARAYRRFRPDVIKCFPNSLVVFADFVRRRGLDLPPVRAISCTGENLYDHQRELFQEVFGGEVFEKYGTKECGIISCESPAHEGQHVFTEGVYLEVLDPRGEPCAPGEMGRIVVTDLFNRGMPLIRYDIGDMAVAGPRQGSAGGPPLPLVRKILGRDRDIILDGDGNPKPGYLFVEAINHLDLPGQFQVVQPSRDQVKVRVAAGEAEGLDLGPLRQAFTEILGPRVELVFEYVDEIPRDPSGKYRYVVSELERGQRAA